MNSRIPQEFIQQIILQTDIIEIIGARIQLKKRGQNHTGLCPFHDEKSASFNVHQHKQFYHCFGCAASGNVIGFIIEYDRLDFRATIEYLAKKLGLELPESCFEEPQQDLSNHFKLMQKTIVYYQKQLQKSAIAKDYLSNKRHLSEAVIEQFSLGYAPAGWEHIAKAVKSTEEKQQLTEIAVLKMGKKNHYDYFRDRIICPIIDDRGRPVGLGGRTLGDEKPKYLNSPETPLFHKNQQIYGLYQARQANRELNQLVIVEGYMDVLALHQHGINYAVATMGTAINTTHINKLLRNSSEIIYCFDGDKAGTDAAWRAVLASLPSLRDGVCFKVLYLPSSHDPDSYVRQHGSVAFKELINSAKELPDVLFEKLQTEHPLNTGLSAKAAFAKKAYQLLESMPKGIFKQLMLDRTAELVGINFDEIQPTPPPIQRPRLEPEKAPLTAETHNLDPTLPNNIACSILLQQPELFDKLQDSLLKISHNPHTPLLNTVINALQTHPCSNIGTLFSILPESIHQSLSTLAARDTIIPAAGLKAELKGAIARIIETTQQRQIDTLIQKSKHQALTENERRKLSALLHEKSEK
jgi:DNA primase